MPNSVASQDSHRSIPDSLPDSLPSLSDHDSITSAASSHSSVSNLSAYLANPPHTHSLPLAATTTYHHNNNMHAPPLHHHHHHHQQQQPCPASGPQRSSTIRASSHAAPLNTASDPPSSALPAFSSSPPILHSLILPPDTAASATTKSHPSSHVSFNHAHLALDEPAPRLSMSSTASGSTTEITTPEGVHQSWPYHHHHGSALAALRSSSPQPLDHQNQLPCSQAFAAQLHLRSPSCQLDAASSPLDALAIQRPAKLEHLSSAVTNATVKGSTRSDDSPKTATQSPRSFHVPELSSLRISSGVDACLSASASASPTVDNHVLNRAHMTSPDSWRSLLPEHDPYFASEGQLRAWQHQRSASPKSLHASSNAFDIDTYVGAKTLARVVGGDRTSISSFDTARTSFSSAVSGYSAMSMSDATKHSIQSHDSARSDSWRSLLPDHDRYHASRGTSSAQPCLDGLSSVASRSLCDHVDSCVCFDGHNHRSAFFALNAPRSAGLVSSIDADSAARRHSSFSSVEPDTSTQYAATRVMLASMRDTCTSLGNGASVEARAVHSSVASTMTPALSHSTIEDSSERDSWPTSRGGRDILGASSPVSSGPLTPETAHTPHSTSLLGHQSSGITRVDTPEHVSETSDNVVKATQTGLLTTTTTTTQLLSDASTNTTSQQDVDDELCSEPTKTRASSCSISTPMSPPSLPFLERRPAPPETDLVIETERSKYTLVTRLPGFSLDCITLATKQHSQHRTLHIVADKWDTEGGGHFERRITFPDKECDLKNVKAEFDGTTLKVYVPRKSPTNRFSSASSATF